AFKQIRATDQRPRLLIAPRHPERFEDVAKLIEDSGFSWSKRSAVPSPADAKADIVLLDSIGELRAAYQSADLAFMGGSLIPHGGQNPLEPAAQAVCVVTGAHTHNFADIIRALRDRDAIVQLPVIPLDDAPGALANAFAELLRDDSRRTSIGARAQEVCAENRGATERTVGMIANLLEPAAATADVPSFSNARLTAAK
ncbi:MAG TPA: hypothetical protein VE961_10525, partial [Pyrinomonadaceae bacterium]|nr:hypothetical protein [Pyrinomonadaceae bacterium]